MKLQIIFRRMETKNFNSRGIRISQKPKLMDSRMRERIPTWWSRMKLLLKI